MTEEYMLTELEEPRVLRDPIHGYIHIRSPLIWQLLDTPEFQRLRRIRQLGGVFQVYHTAEHSRFSHSLGVYEIVRRMTEEVPDIARELNQREKLQVMCAALLHDIGHGPFSHSFERLSACSHEQMTINLILQDTEIHRILAAADSRLPAETAAIIQGTHPKTLLCDMISGQLDADRMDYLLRDAYETGTSYGTFDLERILRCLRVSSGRLCIKESGMHSVEDYIMARYHMYWQVYLHPVARSFEVLLQLFFDRYSQIRQKTPIMLLENVYELSQPCRFLELADYRLLDWVEDPSVRQQQALQRALERLELPEEFYLKEDVAGSKVYLPYHESQAQILVLDPRGQIHVLSERSAIVCALDKMEPVVTRRLYFPRELYGDAGLEMAVKREK